MPFSLKGVKHSVSKFHWVLFNKQNLHFIWDFGLCKSSNYTVTIICENCQISNPVKLSWVKALIIKVYILCPELIAFSEHVFHLVRGFYLFLHLLISIHRYTWAQSNIIFVSIFTIQKHLVHSYYTLSSHLRGLWSVMRILYSCIKVTSQTSLNILSRCKSFKFASALTTVEMPSDIFTIIALVQEIFITFIVKFSQARLLARFIFLTNNDL